MEMWNPFKDKQIIVVGNAKSLATCKKRLHTANLIDSHEIVIRINAGAYVTRPETMGSKTNYCFFDNIYNWDFSKVLGTKVIVSKDPKRSGRNKRRKFLSKRRRIQYFKTFVFLPMWNDKDTTQKLQGAVPSSGALILNYLSHCQCKEVNIIGFDWKTTPTFYHGDNSRTAPHDFEMEKQYFLSFIEAHKSWKHIRTTK